MGDESACARMGGGIVKVRAARKTAGAQIRNVFSVFIRVVVCRVFGGIRPSL